MIKVVESQTIDIESLAIDVFLKALEIAGGPKRLIEFRNLTWVPTLLAASYAIVLREEQHKLYKEIAEFLGLATETVGNMLRANPAIVKRKLNVVIKGQEQNIDIKTHMAGGLAKLAYREIKSGEKTTQFLTSAYQEAASLLGVLWPLRVLKGIKGLSFPISREQIKEHLGNIEIQNKKIQDLADNLPEEIKSPSELLNTLKTTSTK